MKINLIYLKKSLSLQSRGGMYIGESRALGYGVFILFVCDLCC